MSNLAGNKHAGGKRNTHITPGITKILTITSTITPVSTKSWVSVGTEGLTTGGASWTSIKGIGKDLYVAYIDANDGFAKCMKYSDSHQHGPVLAPYLQEWQTERQFILIMAMFT
jgi:hypothetical protein